MKAVFFVHAITSCWNNGNAHFLRGVVTALQRKGHEVIVYEPLRAWSRENLIADHGTAALDRFEEVFPSVIPRLYDPDADLEELIDGADLVIAHEWNDPALVNRLGRLRANGGEFILLFHDTHHRAATQPDEMRRFDLSGFDGVLAFGGAIADLYRRRGWSNRVWTWHEAADMTVFRPRDAEPIEGDVVWIGNWGDEERSEELREFLLDPVEALGLAANVCGVRYPEAAQAELVRRGIAYRGWIPNHDVPAVFARHRLTVHVPRRPYARALPGIPTIRVFEALACGIPLVSAPWFDAEGMFPQDCFLMAADGEAMKRQIRTLLDDPDLAAALARNGLAAVRGRHTCDHRVDQLLGIYASVAPANRSATLREAV
jgi:spore maturation protein CgeB